MEAKATKLSYRTNLSIPSIDKKKVTDEYEMEFDYSLCQLFYTTNDHQKI